MSLENDVERLYQLTLEQNKAIADHGSTLGALKQGQDDLIKRLLGNGQPGEIQMIKSRVAATEADIISHGKKFAWFAGVSSAIGVIVTFVSTFLHFHHH